MKKISLIVLLLLFLVSGCVYQADLRPEYNDKDVWVCEKPYIELCWSKTNGTIGKIIVADDDEETLFHEANYGPLIKIYTSEAKDIEDLQEQKNFLLFKGRISYGKEKLEIEVQEDFKNIFNGDKPTLKFKRYDKEEYFKDKE